MRISDVHIDGFGVWHDLSISKISPEVTTFYGPNEAGKTTLMQFLRSILYGMNAQRRRRYMPPLAGGRPGGWLNVDSDDGRLKVNRIADRGPTDIGKVTVMTEDGQEHGDRLLREALEHVDEQTYNNVFAVGLRDIQELSTLDGTAAAQWLYRLTSGLDSVSLYDVIHLLRGSLTRILNVQGKTSEIRTLLAQRDSLQGEMDELIAKGRRWAQSAVKLGELADGINHLQDEQKQLVQRGRRLETAINLKPLWIRRTSVDDEIAAYNTLAQLPDGAIASLEELNEKIEEHDRQRDIHKGQRHQLRDEIGRLGINKILEMNCCRLGGLEEQQEWLESLQRQSDALNLEVETLQNRLEQEHEQLIDRWLGSASQADHITPELLEGLAPQAKAIEATEQLVERAETDLSQCRGSELTYRSQLEAATANGEKRGMPGDIKQASDLVANLRHRLKVEDRVEKSRRSIRDLENENFELAESQLIPMERFVFLLGVSVVSCALLGARMIGWIEGDSDFGLLASWAGGLGIAGCGLAIFWKYFREQMAANRLDEWYLQMDDAEKAHKQATKEQHRLARDMPLVDGSAKLRLEQAERHLGELEQALPVENQRRAARQDIEAAEMRLEQAQQKQQASLNNWQNKLRALGLSDNVAPADVEAISRHREQLEQLEDRASGRKEESQRRQREFETVTRRIHNLAVESELVLEDAEPLKQLNHLLEFNREEKARRKHRDELAERAKELKVEERRHARASVGLSRRRETLFQQCGVDTEQELRDLVEQHNKCVRLFEKRTGICREIAAGIGQRGTEEEFAVLLSPEAIGRLELDWETVGKRGEEIEAELKKLLEDRGRLVEQQRRLAEDRSLMRKQIEIDEVDHQLRLAKEAWRERAVVYHMLERIRADYEKNRQPETLVEASQYMRKLTSGRYQRVWTPLADDSLMVETADGQSLPVDVLSTGTREQLFVSLRLAMVAMYARRGIQLPMILDDVCVNFDIDRTQTAVQVICEFAKQGHQVLFFTCHEHVWRMFKEINSDVRRLPDRLSGTNGFELEGDGEVEVANDTGLTEFTVDAVVSEPEPEPETEPEPKPKTKRKKKRKPEPAEVVEAAEEYVEEYVEEVAQPLPEYIYHEIQKVEPTPLPQEPLLAEYEYEWGPELRTDPESRTDLESRTDEVEYEWAHQPAYQSTDDWLSKSNGHTRPLPEPIVEAMGDVRRIL